jgi:hypothetical protein
VPRTPPWELIGFHDALRRWIAEEEPPAEIEAYVRDWVRLFRFGLPAENVHRLEEGDQPKVGAFWFVEIPDTRHTGLTVRCSYWLNAETGHITCASIHSEPSL